MYLVAGLVHFITDGVLAGRRTVTKGCIAVLCNIYWARSDLSSGQWVGNGLLTLVYLLASLSTLALKSLGCTIGVVRHGVAGVPRWTCQ